MNNRKSGSVSTGSIGIIGRFILVTVTALAVCMPLGTLQADSLWTPFLNLSAIHDDNILFSRTDAQDDYIYAIEPGLQYDYSREVTHFHSRGSAYIRRYQDNDDLNDEIYNFELNGDSNLTERFSLRGNYEFIKDTTLDSELLETGRIFVRQDRINHRAGLGTKYYLNERMSLGLQGGYRDVAYESNSNDYSVWNVNLPLRWDLITQVDAVYISPGYSFRDSDTRRSKTYDLQIGWDHATTERLKMNLSVGARYTEHENLNNGSTDESWNGVGDLQLSYNFETGKLILDFRHNLENTAGGDQVNVTRLVARLRWNFTERVGMELRGRYVYAKNEGENNTDTTEYYQVGPEIFYNLTENHVIFIAYDYAQDYQKDLQVDPRAERNRIWAGVSLNFPI